MITYACYTEFMKSKELKTYNLPEDSMVLAQIDAKPNSLFGTMIIAGLFMLLPSIPKIYGVVLILFSLGALIYTPRVVLMEFYNEYLVVYNRADKNKCVLIYYEDVLSWSYSRGANRDYLYIELDEGKQERIEAFSKTVFESNMNRFLKDKYRKFAQ